MIEITKVNFLEQDPEFYSLPSALVLVPDFDSALPSQSSYIREIRSYR
ncbi:hypothetical protein [Candidatus Nitrosocosmicus sp. T]